VLAFGMGFVSEEVSKIKDRDTSNETSTSFIRDRRRLLNVKKFVNDVKGMSVSIMSVGNGIKEAEADPGTILACLLDHSNNLIFLMFLLR
jgi:hypothetical protein